MKENSHRNSQYLCSFEKLHKPILIFVFVAFKYLNFLIVVDEPVKTTQSLIKGPQLPPNLSLEDEHKDKDEVLQNETKKKKSKYRKPKDSVADDVKVPGTKGF